MADAVPVLFTEPRTTEAANIVRREIAVACICQGAGSFQLSTPVRRSCKSHPYGVLLKAASAQGSACVRLTTATPAECVKLYRPATMGFK